MAPGQRRDCGTRRAAALAARGRLHGAGRRVRAATTSAAGTRVRSARCRGWERRRDGPTARAPRSGGAAAAGGGGCAGAARLAWPVAETRAQQQLPRSAPGGRCVRQGPAPRPRRRSPRPEAGGEGGIRPGLKPGGSGVWAGLLGKPGPAETRAGPAEGVMGDPPHSCRGMVTRGDHLGPASFTVRAGCARAG